MTDFIVILIEQGGEEYYQFVIDTQGLNMDNVWLGRGILATAKEPSSVGFDIPYEDLGYFGLWRDGDSVRPLDGIVEDIWNERLDDHFVFPIEDEDVPRLLDNIAKSHGEEIVGVQMFTERAGITFCINLDQWTEHIPHELLEG